MRRKFGIFIVFLAILFIIIIINNENKQEEILNATYLEETDQILVNVARPDEKYKPYEYENRLPTDLIISLSERHTEVNTDLFIFDILYNGNAELAFYSIDPQDPNNKYKIARYLIITVTDEAVKLNNEYWRR